VEDVTAWQFLWCHVWAVRGRRRRAGLGGTNDHLLATDDACMVRFAGKFLGGRVRVALIHVARGRAVALKRGKPRYERVPGHVHLPDEVEREPVERHDDREKGEVRRQLAEI
jgi:hypothetical protein